jgi:flavin-binding protein dodecin
MLEAKDYTGYSETSLNEAIANALQKADKQYRFEVIETRSSLFPDKCHYHVTLTAYGEPA